MRKLVFKGIINGKEFDNVQDYNTEMNRLLSSGETNISASSSTSVVDEPVVEQKINKKPEKPFDIQDYLIFFNDNCEQYYLDALVSNDDALNGRNLNLAGNVATSAYNKLVEDLKSNKLTVDEAFSFVNMLKEIRSRIAQDSEDNHNTCDELEKRIEQDKKKLNLLTNAKPIINTLSKYYDDAFNLVRDYLLNL